MLSRTVNEFCYLGRITKDVQSKEHIENRIAKTKENLLVSNV